MSHSDKEEKEWYSVLSVDGVKIKFKLDSGATCNVIPRELLHSLPQCRIQRLRPGGPRVKGYGANGRFLHVLGISTCKVDHRSKVSVIDLILVDEPGQPPILGLPSCKLLNLIQRVDAVVPEASSIVSPAIPRYTSSDITKHPPIVQKFADVFNGLGKIATEHEIKLLPGHAPVVCAAARLPF